MNPAGQWTHCTPTREAFAGAPKTRNRPIAVSLRPLYTERGPIRVRSDGAFAPRHLPPVGIAGLGPGSVADPGRAPTRLRRRPAGPAAAGDVYTDPGVSRVGSGRALSSDVHGTSQGSTLRRPGVVAGDRRGTQAADHRSDGTAQRLWNPQRIARARGELDGVLLGVGRRAGYPRWDPYRTRPARRALLVGRWLSSSPA
jgi:hypothetical protein